VQAVRNRTLINVASRVRYVKEHLDHDDAMSRQAVRLLKYREVSASDRSHSVILSWPTSSSSATNSPPASRWERSAIRLDLTALTLLSAKWRSMEFSLPSSFS